MDRKAPGAFYRRLVGLVIGIGLAFALHASASAATLWLSPAAQSAAVNSNFTVTVYVESSDQSINAISGVLSFPTEKLEVISLSKTDSAAGLWVQEPSYSNLDGTVRFEGVVLNPGYQGSAGKVISVRFRVKEEGQAILSFPSASVLANDGQGTNVLTGTSSGTYTLTAAAKAAPNEPSVTKPAAPTPVAASPTTTSSINALTPAVVPAPKISLISGRTEEPGRDLVVEGTAFSNAKINLYLRRTDEFISQSGVADARGSWRITYSGDMNGGIWEARAEAVTIDGAVSPQSDAVEFRITSWFARVLHAIKEWGVLTVLAILAIGFLAMVAMFIVYHLQMAQARLRRQLWRLRNELHGDLIALQKDTEKLRSGSRSVNLGPARLQKLTDQVSQDIVGLEDDIAAELRSLEKRK